MLQYDFEDSVGHWIFMASHAIRRKLTARLTDAGITIRQWEVLAWLAYNDDVSQAELAECMGIEPHTLAGVVNRMERDGWLVRRSCTNDRRRNRLAPTEKAEQVWEQATKICHEVRAQAISGFTPAELSLLKKLCLEIRDNLVTEDDACHPCVRTAASRSAAAQA